MDDARCLNCGRDGHFYKCCHEPKTSYGIIPIHVNDISHYNALKNILKTYESIKYNKIVCGDEKTYVNFQSIKKNIKYLMVMRKHSVGFIDFVRGNYRTDDVKRLTTIFEQMTPNEIKLIEENSNNFGVLWKHLWDPHCSWLNTHADNYDDKIKKKALDDYRIAEIHNIKLRNSVHNAAHYINTTKPLYKTPEWGFPKGRRVGDECDIECAKREMNEETGLSSDDYDIFDNISPCVENIMGTNGIKYRYIYYIALLHPDAEVKYTKVPLYHRCEIGNISLFDLDNAMAVMRNDRCARKSIIYNLFVQLVGNGMALF